MTTLQSLLRRGHVRIAGVAVLVFTALLLLIGHLVVGRMQSRHLDLVARTAAYSVEAAVTFRDTEAADKLLGDLARQEQLDELRVVMPDGRVFAEVRPPPRDEVDALVRRLGRRLTPEATTAPVRLEGQRIAEVQLRDDGRMHVGLIGLGTLGLLACLGASVVTASLMTRRMERSIVAPIARLSALTREIRHDRTFDRRAPPADIVEIQALGDDFNAMLDEVQAREAELMAHQTQLQSDNAVLARRALHDELTGLANRAHFESRLGDALARVAQRGGHLGVLFMDADGFKTVNDTAGHAAGDRLLVQMAERLRVAVRETDVVARLGGDEFAVLLDPLRSVDDARRVGQKITVAMEPVFDLEEFGRFRCGLSIGMASYPLDGETLSALLSSADRAMYRAKQAGRRMRRSLGADTSGLTPLDLDNGPDPA